MGKMEDTEFPSFGPDEIGRLSQAFTRMKKSLAQAMRMLDESSGGRSRKADPHVQSFFGLFIKT